MKIITTTVAAVKLGVSTWTIRSMLKSERLNGEKLSPRHWVVFVDKKFGDALERKLFTICGS